MGTDLNLHRKTATVPLRTDEDRARAKEILNRERTWLYVPTLALDCPHLIAF